MVGGETQQDRRTVEGKAVEHELANLEERALLEEIGWGCRMLV